MGDARVMTGKDISIVFDKNDFHAGCMFRD